jgi:hypothetical protein
MEDEFDLIANTKPSDIGAEFDAIARSKPRSTKTKQDPSFGEKAKSFLYGAGTGVVSGLGELEKFGAYDLPKMFPEAARQNLATIGVLPETDEKPKGRQTILPTMKEVERGLQKVGIQPPREEVSGYRTAGELLGGFGLATPRLARGAGRVLGGEATQTGERLARRAEELGLQVKAPQVRESSPVSLSSSRQSQTRANQLASESTGAPGVNEIDDAFIRNRLGTLGNEYENLFANQRIRLDPQSIQALQDVSNIQNLLPNAAAGVSPAARQSVNFVLAQARQSGSAAGPELQRVRSGLLAAARRSPDMATRQGIFDLLEGIDQSIARNHPQIFGEIQRLNPLYRNTVNLEQLMQQGGIVNGDISLERLGNMLGQRTGSVRYQPTGLDELGLLGRNLGLRARWEPAGRLYTPEMAAAGQIAGIRTGAVEALARFSTPFQRNLQRRLQPPAPAATRAGRAGQAAVGALERSPATTGTLTGIGIKQFQPEEE